MNKVMTRAKHHPGTRPPGRLDTRRPSGAPPRTPGAPPRTAGAGGRPPGGGAAGRTATAGRPPGSPRGAAAPTRTGPADTRPPSAPATRPPAAPDPAGRTSPIPEATPRTAPARSSHRQVPQVPQPRPTDLFADRLLAVLSGRRPVHCMLRHTAGRAYDELAWLAERGPLRTTRGTRPVVRDIGYYVPREGAIEVFARVSAGDRLRALAFRLEQGPDLRWRCTAVELGGPRPPRTDDA